MSLALLVFKLQLTSHRMATILYFANMAAPSGALLGTHQKSKQYDLGDLCAKFGVFKRI